MPCCDNEQPSFDEPEIVVGATVLQHADPRATPGCIRSIKDGLAEIDFLDYITLIPLTSIRARALVYDIFLVAHEVGRITRDFGIPE